MQGNTDKDLAAAAPWVVATDEHNLCVYQQGLVKFTLVKLSRALEGNLPKTDNSSFFPCPPPPPFSVGKKSLAS